MLLTTHKKEPLTKKQKEILDFISSQIDEHGYAPSYREIGEHFGLSSTATIAEYISSLKNKGYLSKEEKQARSLEIIEDKHFLNNQILSLPLMGLITAGLPIEAIEEKETMTVPADLVVDNYNSYVLKVKGDSMIEDGILDGDYVIIERNPSPKNGDIVVALLDNAFATLKRFYRESNRIRLQPANSKFKPIFCQDLIIQGVVRAVIRKFQPA